MYQNEIGNGTVEVEVLNWQRILQVVYQVKQNGIYSHNSRYLVTEYAFNVVLCSLGVFFFKEFKLE